MTALRTWQARSLKVTITATRIRPSPRHNTDPSPWHDLRSLTPLTTTAYITPITSRAIAVAATSSVVEVVIGEIGVAAVITAHFTAGRDTCEEIGGEVEESFPEVPSVTEFLQDVDVLSVVFVLAVDEVGEVVEDYEIGKE